MENDNFQKNLLKHTEDFRKVLATPSGDWSVKGFIDIHVRHRVSHMILNLDI